MIELNNNTHTLRADIFKVGFISTVLLSNIFCAKTLCIGPFLAPGGILLYSISFLFSDLIGELYGKKMARQTMWLGIIFQVIFTFLLQLLLILPGKDALFFDSALSNSAYFLIASLLADCVAQNLDIFLFHHLKVVINQKTNRTYKWVYENISTIVSQIINSAIFVVIGYGLGLRASFTFMLNIFIGQIILKSIIAILDTPIFYLLTKSNKKENN